MKSILDNDLYKFTMQNAVLEMAPTSTASYKFINRGNEKFSREAYEGICRDVKEMENLSLTDGEAKWFRQYFPCLFYIYYLSKYRYDSDEVKIDLHNGDLKIDIKGPWSRTILWEVPLLAIISKNYYLEKEWDADEQNELARIKAARLASARCHWADFGTRRRRNYETQELVIKAHSRYESFLGTSNVHLAHKYWVEPIGTMAHEWIMAMSAIYGGQHANKHALEKWRDVYGEKFGIALTDTYGTQVFFRDFDGWLTSYYNGVRHDSGCPFVFVEKLLAHYRKFEIDPMTKAVVFSDGLDVNKAIQLNSYCKDKIPCSFGIGTHLTNDFTNSPAMNIVIKLDSIDGVEVAKLSDEQGKECGSEMAIKKAKRESVW